MQGSICAASPSDARPVGGATPGVELRYQAIGLLVLATFTGLFWAALIGVFSWLAGAPLAWNALFAIFLGILTLVAIFAAPLFGRRDLPASMEDAMAETAPHK